MIRLTTVEPRPDYALLLTFSDGTCGVYDFAPIVAAGTDMTAPLADPAFFARYFIELGALTWPDGFDLSAATLRDAGTLERVRTVA